MNSKGPKHHLGLPVLVCICLLVLAVYQGIWLTDRYHKEHDRLSEEVAECLALADYTELESRMQKLRKDPASQGKIDVSRGYSENGRMTQQVSINYDDTVRPNLKMNSAFRDTVSLKRIEDFLTVGQLSYKGIHAALDHITDIDFKLTDSLLSSALEERNIHVEHRLFLIRIQDSLFQATDSATLSSPLYAPKPTGKILARGKGDMTPNPIDDFTEYKIPVWISTKKTDYLFPFEFSMRFAYYMKVSGLSFLALKNMNGLIMLSLFTILLTMFAMTYLWKTLLRIEKIKEMERNFVHNITHELKTPLSVAMAAKEVLQYEENPLPSEKRTQYLNIIGNKLEELGELINQILLLGRAGKNPETARTIQVNEYLTKIAEEFRLRIPENGTLDLELDENLQIVIRPQDFNAIIYALLDNALKYSTEEIFIKITARTKGKGKVEITVSDHGKGIPATALPYIFDQFYRVPEGDVQNVRGYGLGLSHAKELMQHYSGSIDVKSTPGKGSIFILHFIK
ncbi:hypothetical protein HQ47_01345 [Porphyromonas macacae]|uniref:histidine kinase n=1 Tax=Porphyromonas macacae TaxID=28115 RepID=A0A0A2E9Q1_9PORP|nr:HAMP domain-containing sensor histidine kinase [Porphyromonas macacae]KGN75616.1 hypothetical protein HQ47_01345 [Porphyromonas macacae]